MAPIITFILSFIGWAVIYIFYFKFYRMAPIITFILSFIGWAVIYIFYFKFYRMGCYLYILF